jgi:GNAT superfamily N-acetyltransferase
MEKGRSLLRRDLSAASDPETIPKSAATGLTHAKMDLQLRRATLEDIPLLRALIDVSVRSLHTKFYTEAQIAGALKGVYGVDTQVINDGHYFVVTSPSGTIVACGGWSHRSTLFGSDSYSSRDDKTLLNPETQPAKIRAMFVHPGWVRRGIGKMILDAGESAAREAGFWSMEMSATLNGVPFYRKFGYREVEGGKHEVPLGDGVVIDFYMMRKDLVP